MRKLLHHPTPRLYNNRCIGVETGKTEKNNGLRFGGLSLVLPRISWFDKLTTGGFDTLTTGGFDTLTTGGFDTLTTGGFDTLTTGKRWFKYIILRRQKLWKAVWI